MPRRIRPPLSLVNSSRVKKSRTACSTGIGTKSWTWKPSAERSSSSGSHGRSTWRTITFWFATPMTTFLLRELRVGPQLLDGLAHGTGVDHLAVAHGPFGERDLAELLEGDLGLAERQLGGAHPRRPDVETDGGSSCHDANLSNGGTCLPHHEPARDQP